ncbi:alpha/beta hydrolase [Actinomadura sp. ATCC 31491]|uniref:Alpha/beta hydrolase n=1 Tax=Actinomadura luzonensis TaxID=2805427 RepID=A0ABT0FSS6_9ACTN|nr:alpha/beta hydrolase [Actinomadura luzonensis]MCK2215397.1 alpha/beta hydrolase [Actinomadura luzonensis]
MRDRPGRKVPVNGRHVYVEESGDGPDQVVFEAGAGCGRTCWDPVLPLLAGRARLVAYDRAGFGRSGRTTGTPGIDDLAADLVAMTEAVVPGRFVLVAHSMGGLVARRAAESLAPRLRGLLLVDPLAETAPVYDTWDRTTGRIDRTMALTQALAALRPLARLLSGGMRRLYPRDTYETMLAEDFTPAGIAQTRKEMRAVAAAITDFRRRPPQDPKCPVVVLAAAGPAVARRRQETGLAEHQRRLAAGLPDGRFEEADTGHFIQAEQPRLVADRILGLLGHP